MKYVQGKCMYKYKGILHFEQPKHTRITKLLYSSDTNTTYAVCKKNGLKTEVLCSIVILACVVISLFYHNKDKELLYYQSNVIWYNGVLYLNIENSQGSRYPIRCGLLYNNKEVGCTTLYPGEKWLTVPIEYNGEDVSLHIEYQYPWFKRYDTLPISVNIK